MANQDKAGRDYWNKTERNLSIRLEAFRATPGIRGFGRQLLHQALSGRLAREGGQPGRLLELGCGGSAFLPYLATTFGYQVAGLDYSETGCELARAMCRAYGVHADIRCDSMFGGAEDWSGMFDVVVSFGLVEHFTDTSSTLREAARFLRPGGMLLTLVPNMAGIVGAAQRMLARDVFAKHEILDVGRLSEAHAASQLRLLACEYVLFVNMGVVNPGSDPGMMKRLALAALKAATGAVWALEQVTMPFSPNRWTSPYLLSAAVKAP